MEKWKNPVKARLEAGEFVVGATITTNNVEVPALVAKVGFHFLWGEMEHSPLTLENLRNIVLASRALPAAVFSRVLCGSDRGAGRRVWADSALLREPALTPDWPFVALFAQAFVMRIDCALALRDYRCGERV